MREINIAVGHKATSTNWKNEKTTWPAFADRLAAPIRTGETLAQYAKASPEDRAKIKDVGGYVGGYVRGGRRKPENITFRSLVTLDLDFATADVWAVFTTLYDCAAVLHQTHSHTQDKPKYRLILPLDRDISSDEYSAIARRIAGDVGIDLFDPTGFQPYRLMFWPAVSVDAVYYYQRQDGDLLSADAVLGTYVDWTDAAAWPTSQAQNDETRDRAKKQKDPLEKPGIVGAFCRAYSISEAIDAYLDGAYLAVSDSRYTFTGGSTSGGVVTYEDKFSYSHHGTDPAGGELCNAFDLVRLHRFGHLSKGDSQREMEALATGDATVKRLLMEERTAKAADDFAITDGAPAPVPEGEPIDVAWAEALEVDAKGRYLSSALNIDLILRNDPNLKDKFKFNDFDQKRYVLPPVPWRGGAFGPVQNVDFSGLRNYLERAYGIRSNGTIDDSVAIVYNANSFHPVRDYLNAAAKAWDGVKRIDTLLIDFLGADDTLYTREAIRKMLLGGVARIFRPGCKFDLMLTIVGAQGDGKSTFVRKLGGAWFSDSFNTLKGKEAFEQLQGAWVVEVAELAGLASREVESVKHYLTKQYDTYRPAFGHVVETYQRQCVFFGTTNSGNFLKDATGNRRFLPVDVDRRRATLSPFTDMTPDFVAQVWGEAVAAYRAGETTYLSAEGEALAKLEQYLHQEGDERTGLILAYLERATPDGWEDLDIYDRRAFLDSADRGTHRRHEVSVAEIWCECLAQDKNDMSRYKTKDINNILRGLEGWEAAASVRNFPIYGKQRYYRRKS